jgi:hypothetical protein
LVGRSIARATTSNEAYWVEAAWRREIAADVAQDCTGTWRDGVGAERVEVHQEEEEDLSGPAESALETLPEDEGIEAALVNMKRRLSCLKT